MAKKEKDIQNAPEAEKTENTTDESIKKEEKQSSAKKKAKDDKTDEIASLNEKLAQQSDSFLRLAAEYDNYRKRTSKEKDELYSSSKISVISEFLPVIDNLDRALDNKTDNIDEYKKGVEMIGNQFYETLKKLGAQEFGAVGDGFDPNIHNAVMHIDDETLGESVISAVFSKGYKLGEKVIRHAMVQVAN